VADFENFTSVVATTKFHTVLESVSLRLNAAFILGSQGVETGPRPNRRAAEPNKEVRALPHLETSGCFRGCISTENSMRGLVYVTVVCLEFSSR
jgi:hypothetical protein